MNLAWVIPRSGKSQSRNVHAKDRARLVREGFVLYRLEWSTDARGTRTADVYAQRVPTARDISAGIEALFGVAPAGTVRLMDRSGRVILP
jgi:hypothetical protein